MQAFLRLRMSDGNEVAVNVDKIAGIVGHGTTAGSKVLLAGGHEVEVHNSLAHILVNIQRLLVGKEPLAEEA